MPNEDKSVEKIAKSVEALLWNRQTAKADTQDKPTRETEGEISLTDKEARTVAIDHVEERQTEVQRELTSTQPGTEAEVVARANELLLQKDEEHLGNSNEAVREALDAAASEAEQYILTEEGVVEQPAVAEARFAMPMPERVPQEILEETAAARTYIPMPSMAPTTAEWRASSTIPQEAPAPEVRNPVLNYFTRRRSTNGNPEWGTASVRTKLEKQVQDVRESVSVKERHIRKVAAEQYERRARSTVETSSNEPSSRIEQYPSGANAANNPETTPTHQPETILPVPEYKSVQTMTHQELLKVSEKIVVEGASLRSVYESKRITEKGLRRLVGEYFRGGNMPKRLAKEILEHERGFERDPQLREHFAGQGIDGSGASGLAADSQATTGDHAFSGLTAKQSKARLSLAKAVTSPQKVAMTAWVTLILLLAVVAAILILTRL